MRDNDRNKTLHKDTSTLLFTVQEKMESNLEDVDKMLVGNLNLKSVKIKKN